MAVQGDGVDGRLTGTSEFDWTTSDVIVVHGLVRWTTVPTVNGAWNKFLFGKRTVGSGFALNMRSIVWNDTIANGVVHGVTANDPDLGVNAHFGSDIPSAYHSATAIVAGRVYAFGMVYDYSDQSTIDIYINGVGYTLNAQNTLTVVSDPNCPFSFLAPIGSVGSFPSPATIQHWALWKNPTFNLSTGMALLGGLGGSLGVLAGQYASPMLPYFATGLERYWPLTETSGTTFRDVVNGDTMTADGGISIVSGFNGVHMNYSSQPDSTTGIDGRFDKVADTNTPDGATINVGSDGAADWRRAFIVFDLAEDGAIGTNYIVSDALLTIRWTSENVTGTVTGSIRAILGDASDIVENQMTYTLRKTGTAWTTPGGDFLGSAVAFNFPASGAATASYDVNALVQAAVTAGYTKIGFIIHKDDETTDDSVAASFASCENATAGNRPKLEFVAAAPATGGGISGVPGFSRILSLIRNKDQ